MITSKSNELIKHVKSLAQKKYRDEYKEFIIEGEKLIEEAINENIDIKTIFVSEKLNVTYPNKNIETVSESVFEYISETKSPQGVLAVAKQMKPRELEGNTVFALEHVQDPGNVGTIIRTLDACRS